MQTYVYRQGDKMYKWGDEILVSHLVLYHFYQCTNVLFWVVVSFGADIMQLVLICKGLVTNVLRAGAARLLRSGGASPAGTMAAAVGKQPLCLGRVAGCLGGSSGMHFMS